MPLTFKNSPKPTLGVELEVQLIDKRTRNLSPKALQILKRASQKNNVHLKAELTQAIIEIDTEICNTVPQIGSNLGQQLKELRSFAHAEEVEIAISGTHPFQDWHEGRIYPDSRYLQIVEKFQWLARRWITYGMHVHVGVRDGDRAIAIMNSLISYIPHLIALSASSPFWGGTDTGLTSSRLAILESLPTGGLPYYFVNWKEFEKYFETLTTTEAIKSIKDIYWLVRPHFNFGTIEVRVCDGIPTLKETLALVAFIQCLVVWIDDQIEKGERLPQIHMQRYWLAPENKWQAIRYGLEAQIIVHDGEERHPIREEIEKLVETLKPIANTLGCADELAFIKTILKKNPSYERQKRIFLEKRSLPTVVDSLITELLENRTL